MQDAWALSECIWCWPGWRRLLTLRLRSDDDYSCDLLSHLVDLEYQIYWSFYVREYPVGISRGSIVEGGTWAPIPVHGHDMSWAIVELRRRIVEMRTWIAPIPVHWFGLDLNWAACKYCYYSRRSPVGYQGVGKRFSVTDCRDYLNCMDSWWEVRN